MTRAVLAIFPWALAMLPPAMAGDRVENPAPRYVLTGARVEIDRPTGAFDLREARVELAGDRAGFALSAVRIGTGTASCGPRPEEIHYSGFEAGE